MLCFQDGNAAEGCFLTGIGKFVGGIQRTETPLVGTHKFQSRKCIVKVNSIGMQGATQIDASGLLTNLLQVCGQVGEELPVP